MVYCASTYTQHTTVCGLYDWKSDGRIPLFEVGPTLGRGMWPTHRWIMRLACGGMQTSIGERAGEPTSSGGQPVRRETALCRDRQPADRTHDAHRVRVRVHPRQPKPHLNAIERRTIAVRFDVQRPGRGARPVAANTAIPYPPLNHRCPQNRVLKATCLLR